MLSDILHLVLSSLDLPHMGNPKDATTITERLFDPCGLASHATRNGLLYHKRFRLVVSDELIDDAEQLTELRRLLPADIAKDLGMARGRPLSMANSHTHKTPHI
jgi:hypothetical protein